MLAEKHPWSVIASRRGFAAAQALAADSAIAYYLPSALLVVAAAVLQSIFERSPVFPFDDSYITLHNAQILHWGYDPNFRGTPALAGATSPVHLALTALLMYFFKPLWALDAAAWLGVFALAMGIARIAKSQGAPAPAAFLLSTAGLLCARMPHHLMNGLETGLAMAGLAWSLALASEERQASAIGLGALCGLLPFLRPELAAISLLLIPLPAWRVWRESGSARTAALLFGKCVLSALITAAPWMIWLLASTGSVAPATIAAKRYFFAEAGLPDDVKWHWTTGNLTAFLQSVGPLALAAVLLPFTTVGRIGIAFAVVMLTSYYCHFPGALGHNQARYLYILAPLLIFAAASSYRLLSRWEAPRRWVTLFLLIAAFQAGLFAPATWREHQNAQAFTRIELIRAADWCNANLPPSSRLLIHDAGYISYGTRFEMVDLVGLKSPENIAFHRALTFPTTGKKRGIAIAAIASKARPDYLVVLDFWDSLYKISDSLRNAGWRIEPVRVNGAYHVFHIIRPDDYDRPAL